MTMLFYLLPWLGCLQLALTYPTEDDGDPLIGRYKILQLAKKDASSPLKDSLLSALFMSEMHGEAQKQRKKAVDSTFIRFGRSSFPVEHHHSSRTSSRDDSNPYGDTNHVLMHQDGSNDLDGIRDVSSGELEEVLPPSEISQSSNPSFGNNFQPVPINRCRLANSGDLIRALMGSTCNRIMQKVKRENVNDTFIRFGKRESPRRMTRSVWDDPQQNHET